MPIINVKAPEDLRNINPDEVTGIKFTSELNDWSFIMDRDIPIFKNVKRIEFKSVKQAGGISAGGITLYPKFSALFPNVENVESPELKVISSCLFLGCKKLKSVDFPKVTKVGSHAFDGCTSLTSVTFGKDVEKAKDAFLNCPSNLNIQPKPKVQDKRGMCTIL